MPSAVSPSEQKMTRLQGLALPNCGFGPDPSEFFQTSGHVAFSLKMQSFSFGVGGTLDFDSWHNLFNLSKWSDAGLERLALKLTGNGAFEIKLWQTRWGRSRELIYSEVHKLPSDSVLDLSLITEKEGLLHVSLTGTSDCGALQNLEWMTGSAPRNQVKLALVTPTFHREDRLTRALSRIADSCPELDQVVVVDHGGTIGGLEGVTLLSGPNLGGSGGFARGAIHAKKHGATHCLFMDDDADVLPEAIHRTYAFLSFARDHKTAVAGAMIAQENQAQIWENGARFHQFCQPLFGQVDLANKTSVVEMERYSQDGKGLYGGWWFFAFPLAGLRHLPFPFFLRGDDVSFSLSNQFSIARLNGVAAYQAGFTAKETPRSWYFDLRSHMLHHLCLPDKRIPALATLKIALFFWSQCVLRMHYDSANAVLSALEDVLKGPSFFARNANVHKRLNMVDQQSRDEIWQHASNAFLSPANPGRSYWYLLGNGLFLPGFGRFGRHRHIKASDRRNLSLFLGASRITVLHESRSEVYQVRHSKRRAFLLGLRFVWFSLRFLVQLQTLRKAYQQSYASLTSEAFWAAQFDHIHPAR